MGQDIRGSVVAITGAARGIGLATVKALLAKGAKVGMSDIDEVLLKEVGDDLGPNVFFAAADVTDPESLRSFIDQVEAELGPIDVMINNAGIMPTGPLLEESEKIARATMEINVSGVITGTKRALESMVPRGRGTIINIASMAGEMSVPGLATYNASKWAALGFTLAVRAEFKPQGIDVVAVCPAFVNTELTQGLGGIKGFDNVEPEDVANAVVEAIGKPKARVYVPPAAARMMHATNLLPEPVTEVLGKLLKATDVMLRPSDDAARREYHERIGKD